MKTVHTSEDMARLFIFTPNGGSQMRTNLTSVVIQSRSEMEMCIQTIHMTGMYLRFSDQPQISCFGFCVAPAHIKDEENDFENFVN